MNSKNEMSQWAQHYSASIWLHAVLPMLTCQMQRYQRLKLPPLRHMLVRCHGASSSPFYRMKTNNVACMYRSFVAFGVINVGVSCPPQQQNIRQSPAGPSVPSCRGVASIDAEPIDSAFCCILLRIVEVPAIVPETSTERLSLHRDSA